NPNMFRRPAGMTEQAYLDLCVSEVEDVVGSSTEGRIAAFIAEPIQGVGGFVVAPQDYLRRVKPIVEEAGGLLIIDEVQTGWGRTGRHLCAVNHWGVQPDIMTFAKGIANGYPLGVTITTPEVAARVDRPTLSTYGGNPVGMATALATVEYIEKHDLAGNAERQGARLRAHLDRTCARFEFVGEVRGMGLMQAIEMVQPGPEKRPDPARANAFVAAARRRGLLLGKGGMGGNVIRIAPPLIVSAEEVDRAAAIIEAALADVA